MTIAEWIRESRKAAGLTQDRLAEQLSLTKGNISAWEKGLHSPSFDQIVKIAQISSWQIPIPGLQEPNPWPFQRISRDDWDRLSAGNKGAIEGYAQALLNENFHAHDRGSSTPTGTHN